jgi:hypothetical protein
VKWVSHITEFVCEEEECHKLMDIYN